MKNFNADLNVVIEAIRKASVKITKDFYEVEKLQISKKGVANFVTKTDLTAEKILVYHLQKSRPEYSFITEESGVLESIKKDDSNEVKYKWIIDPIDGTFNFMHGVPFFCISIALAKITKEESTILLGVVCNPVNNEIFWAGKNMGAFLIDSIGIQRKIKVSTHNDYERVICAIHDDSNSNATMKKYLDFIHLKHSKIRIFGASALEMAYLADGRINLLIQGKLHLWDYAAGLILIREAGGVVRDLNKKDLGLSIYEGVIAGNDRLVSEIERHKEQALFSVIDLYLDEYTKGKDHLKIIYEKLAKDLSLDTKKSDSPLVKFVSDPEKCAHKISNLINKLPKQNKSDLDVESSAKNIDLKSLYKQYDLDTLKNLNEVGNKLGEIEPEVKNFGIGSKIGIALAIITVIPGIIIGIIKLVSDFSANRELRSQQSEALEISQELDKLGVKHHDLDKNTHANSAGTKKFTETVLNMRLDTKANVGLVK